MESSVDDFAGSDPLPLPLAKSHADSQILLVESDSEDAELMLGALADAGMEEASFLVSSGRRALDYLGRRSPYQNVARPCLVLLDLELPDIAGFDVLSRMKACHATATIPVVVLAGVVRDTEIAQAYALGAASYVPKDDGFGKLTNNLALLVFYWFQVARLPGARPGP
jgi:CheY-like chemotaxis protein